MLAETSLNPVAGMATVLGAFIGGEKNGEKAA